MKALLKSRLAAGELLVGTFVKTPSPIVVEVLATSGLDCLCLDAEHAPFDRGTLDSCLLAARGTGMDVIVRVPSAAPEHILHALDCGATGVMVPHVRSAEEAKDVVRASHYGAGGRGFAGSSRATGYASASLTEHQTDSAKRTVVIVQIEDPEAVDAVDAIARVEGVDALFVGRVDLTVSFGAKSQDDPQVIEAVETVCRAGGQAGVPVGMYLSRVTDASLWRAKGATLFLLGSDQGFLLAGAAELLARAKS